MTNSIATTKTNKLSPIQKKEEFENFLKDRTSSPRRSGCFSTAYMNPESEFIYLEIKNNKQDSQKLFYYKNFLSKQIDCVKIAETPEIVVYRVEKLDTFDSTFISEISFVLYHSSYNIQSRTHESFQKRINIIESDPKKYRLVKNMVRFFKKQEELGKYFDYDDHCGNYGIRKNGEIVCFDPVAG
jgi:hypothetical protein